MGTSISKQVCDILIIGAGPAGSSAAMTAAVNGADVLVVDQRTIIGQPVQCAEYIPAQLLGEVNLDPDIIVQTVRSMKTFYRRRLVKKTDALGYMIHRDLFDQSLAKTAIKAGANLLTAARVIRMEKGAVIIKHKNGPEEIINPSVIIGADGPLSITARWMGAQNTHLMAGIQKQVKLNAPINATEIYFDPLFYGGYGWFFPKGKYANVGLATTRGNRSKLGKMLNYLIHELDKEGKIAEGLRRPCAGWIPAGPPRKVVRDNMMLVGDAAGQTHAITGAGIPQAVICGKMAGKWAARAVKADDNGLLNEYEKEWRGQFERTLVLANSRRVYMEENWNRLEDIMERCWVAFKDYHATSD
ncbi:geranylgeranyl reductase family [Desulfocicer vacuolatum DSM 3385]|uniref:Geranylgeranyl reductase family n=1 Tax=Desulfocicer vacuolatum DSM 3385 TaxID=1121400 RepID=A0A1W2D662_9BACT|nr:NAD(P)/FAD-dependent oxidoreductase [Desulfocicer vacuolatum]SMC92664.1 geranylgeranyl reductase family [Desulfocicer vacuolatum DSM 3385]